MQLNQEYSEEEDEEQDHRQNQPQYNQYNGGQNYVQEDYAESEEEEEDHDNMQAHYQQQINKGNNHNEESDNEEENAPMGGMQSKFANMKMENARMFDDDVSEDKHTNAPTLQNPKMEPIEEGYSSDESFGTRQRHKNFQQNLEFVLEENKKKASKIRTLSKDNKPKRNHINLKTSAADNKENFNDRNKSLEDRALIPKGVIEQQKLQRPATAKMRSSVGFRNPYQRPQTAKPVQTKKRPTTAGLSTTSVFGSKKSLKTKMQKKSDPVSRYQSMQNSWSKNKFLKQHKGTKQGRKLDLAGFNQWARMVQSSQPKPVLKQVHKYINPNNPLASNKRDDLRFHLRAKMSQEDYVDKDMKYFHYTKAK